MANEFEDEPLTLRRFVVGLSLFAVVIGFPVTVGAFLYVIGRPGVEAMMVGACSVTIPLFIAVALGAAERAWLRRTRGAPPEVNERVEILRGAHRGKTGVVKHKGQHYPHEIYIVPDDSTTGKLRRFTWRDLRPIRDW